LICLLLDFLFHFSHCNNFCQPLQRKQALKPTLSFNRTCDFFLRVFDLCLLLSKRPFCSSLYIIYRLVLLFYRAFIWKPVPSSLVFFPFLYIRGVLWHIWVTFHGGRREGKYCSSTFDDSWLA
jgi:hypothetical protein